MCGITGVLDLTGNKVDHLSVRRMTEAITYRGPDGEGLFVEEAVGLGHRRLAILDLSDAGNQPMSSLEGQAVLVYNGEIYNYLDLRGELESRGYYFRSTTDSEVVLYGYLAWGEACVERFQGMFSFAIWDRTRRRLFLARDRYGIKPLYWWKSNGVFLFASEIKAILTHPATSRDLCPHALAQYLTFQNILSDHTLFRGIRLLPPAHCMVVDTSGTDPRTWCYWSVSSEQRTTWTEDECVERIREAFVRAVTRQLVSDVPVGAYLSGGMDSGSIVSVAARQTPRLATFTAGFDLSGVAGAELNFDERSDALALSRFFDTQHSACFVQANDIERVLPGVIWHLEDLRVGQCYPNYFAAKTASEHVRVVLSGAGGDELFAGYPWRYQYAMECANQADFLHSYFRYWQRLVPQTMHGQLFRADILSSMGDTSTFDLFKGVFEDWGGAMETSDDFLNASLFFEFKTFLHGLLIVEDKISMAHSLETRLPFLDDDLVQLAFAVPARHKLTGWGSANRSNLPAQPTSRAPGSPSADGKMLLRRAMSKLLPGDITGRAKQGFSAPDATWFRVQSADYVRQLLLAPKASSHHFLNPAFVRQVVDEHCSGQRNHRLLLWSLMSFEWWCRIFLEGEKISTTEFLSCTNFGTGTMPQKD